MKSTPHPTPHSPHNNNNNERNKRKKRHALPRNSSIHHSVAVV